MTHNAKHSTLDAGALGISDCLEARSSAPHEIDDWHWAQTLSVYWQWLSTVNTDLLRSSELWCFRKSTPFKLKGHNFCSRISETMQIETLGITSASSALAARRRGKREKHAAIIHISVSVCVCVSLRVCISYSGVIEHETIGKALFEVDESAFQLDFHLFASRVHGSWKSYTTWEYDYHIPSLYFFAIGFSTFEVVLNEFHSSPVSFETVSPFLWLPRV